MSDPLKVYGPTSINDPFVESWTTKKLIDQVLIKLSARVKELESENAELQRKLKRICKCEFSSGGHLKHPCEFHEGVRRSTREAALEEAANECDEEAKNLKAYTRVWHAIRNRAWAIRALKKQLPPVSKG